MAQARIPSDRPPSPPGEMLLEEFIRPLGMTQAELADWGNPSELLGLDGMEAPRARTWQYGYLRTRALTAWMDQSSAGMRLSGASQPLITASS
jgi:hypothetical protein